MSFHHKTATEGKSLKMPKHKTLCFINNSNNYTERLCTLFSSFFELLNDGLPTFLEPVLSLCTEVLTSEECFLPLTVDRESFELDFDSE